MRIVFVSLLLCSVILLSCAFLNSPNQWKVKSPDGQITFSLEMKNAQQEQDMSCTGALCYSISMGPNTVIESSPLGLERQDESFSKQLTLMDRAVSRIDDTYELFNGKVSNAHNLANQVVFSFVNENDATFDLIVRVYNDGVAFKYAFPDTVDSPKTITQELTGFQLPAGTAYIMPYDEPTQYTPAYENYYGVYKVGDASPTETGWAFPALFEVNDGQNFVLLTESGLNGSYCGTRLAQEAPEDLYSVRFPEEADAEGVGNVYPSSTLPWETSWKVVILGESPGDIVESTLVTDVAEPEAFAREEWMNPGRAAWSWWAESDSPRDFQRQRDFIDLAADLGWEYYLVDANWNYEPTEELLDFIEYATEKGVGVLMWYNSGGPNNIVTEAPRDRMFTRDRRRQEFEWLQEIGVKGVKVDFWHSDKQDMIQYYIDLMHDARDFEMLVNFHGCTIPRGWDRTYPNFMTAEAVSGIECYKFDASYPENAPWHNVNLVFTRGVIGPMDYTPVAFSDHTYPHLTTFAHELALSVLFQSGWQHFADKPESYRAQPQEVQQFLSEVPAAWDEIRFLEGQPAEYVILARRTGDTWYIAGINGLDEAKTLSLDLTTFGTQAQFIGDEQARRFDIRPLPIHESPVHIEMLPYGGFVMTVGS